MKERLIKMCKIPHHRRPVMCIVYSIMVAMKCQCHGIPPSPALKCYKETHTNYEHSTAHGKANAISLAFSSFPSKQAKGLCGIARCLNNDMTRRKAKIRKRILNLPGNLHMK